MALVERVEGGDRSALREPCAMFEAYPDAAVRMFGPARTRRGDLARRVCDQDNLLFPELVVVRAEALRR